jgi:hypothetical protein
LTPGVEAAFTNYTNDEACRYVDYWDKLTARTDSDLFRRFLFAYMSVHTTWESNVSGYKAIKSFEPWLGDRRGLRGALVKSGVGLHNNRSVWIDGFANDFWANPQGFRRQVRESWPAYRSRLEARITGLGPAKVSFALELAYPLQAEVLCLDVHMLRLYGVRDPAKLKVGQYERLEADWVARARAVELPPYIVKQIHWDRAQGKPDSRYWSHALEE